MKRRQLGVLLIGLFGLTFMTTAPATDRVSGVAEWDFNVYLNDRKIGKHSFKVSESAGIKQVQSEANFKYTILLIPAYRYEHQAAERWSDECLVEIDARTNANGERIEVSGEQTGNGFRVVSGLSPAELPQCVMTFAYWNPNFLEQPRLLNPQTGEFVDVTVERLGNEALQVRGQTVDATRFKLTAYEIDLTLWYSEDDEWLALESVAKGGHIIRYELS
jgi:hypothetical protein